MTKPIIIYKADEIEAIRRVGYLASKLLDYITPFVKAGVSTKRLDDMMLEYTVNVLGARSACLHYKPEGHLPRHSERKKDPAQRRYRQCRRDTGKRRLLR